MVKPLHSHLSLVASNDAYTFVPVSDTAQSEQSLTVHRKTGQITLDPPGTIPPVTRSGPITVYGILGIISLASSEYLVVITDRERRGRVLGQDIYRATDFKVLPLASTSTSQGAYLNPVEKHLLSLVHSHLFSSQLWFSYTYDITRRMQAQWVAQREGAESTKDMWEVADTRFFWNRHLITRFIETALNNPDQEFGPFMLPVMYGSFDIRPAQINSRPFLFCLISRRSRNRVGTRYFVRGIDAEGNVANFNETEQIVLFDPVPEGSAQSWEYGSGVIEGKAQLSFVQTRGSVPVFWAEINTLRYKPDLQIMEIPQTIPAMQRHLSTQVELYGSQTLINLVNQHGYEKPVKEAYEKAVAEVQRSVKQVHYEYFDFHKECKGMRFDRVSILTDKLEGDLDAKGYFHNDFSQPNPSKLQFGVVRTNCMDNLDRTNVVQAALAKRSLTIQLRSVGILRDKETVDDHEKFMEMFRNMWADHADAISTAYSGTGALKTDFTRTGKRTKQGLLQDGVNSTIRYIKNNFLDGPRQDAFDLFTGAWVARKGQSGISLLIDKRPLIVRSMPYILSFALFMILAGLTLPRSSDYSLLYYFSFWFLVLALSGAFIFSHGVEYVGWPRLNSMHDKIWYDGPGYRSAQHGKGFGGKAWAAGKVNGYTAASKRLAQPYLASKEDEIEMGTKIRVD